ncbi:hypothetical protein ACN4EG_25200 [Alkalinema pantanalense CENA528]|uniref:hypothetical protein n=1 Tax=Alkalinema pantanalense TaxID=1620705 RepID=UPI003D6F7613
MSYFTPEPDRTITSAWIDQGFDINAHEIKGAIDYEKDAESLDKNIGFAAVAGGASLIAVSLTLTGLTPFLIPSLALAAWGGLTGYNSAINARRRELEEDFLTEFPAILEMVAGKLAQGEPDSKVAAAFDAAFRYYRKGNDEAIAGMLQGNQSPQLPPPQDQVQDQDAPTQQEPTSLPQSASQQAAKPSYAQTGDDVARSLAEKLQSTLIVGQPGAGKGMLIAMATREVKRLHPDVQIWAIDPKADPQEAGYWQACDRMLSIPISPFTKFEDMDYICDRIDGFIAEFQASNKPKLLIFDEALAAREKAPKWFKGLMSGFNALCSMGRSRRQYGWLVSQSPNTDDFGISGGVRNVYRRILLLSQDNLGLLDNGSTYFSGKPTRMLLGQSGRVFFDSTINGWGSVPRYEIPSSPVVPVSNPQPEPAPIGESRRENLERLYRESPAIPDQPPIEETADPMIDLLECEPDPQMRKALLIAYRWARSRMSEGKDVTRESFLNRAKNERKCDYLRENRNEVWDMLDGLIF